MRKEFETGRLETRGTWGLIPRMHQDAPGCTKMHQDANTNMRTNFSKNKHPSAYLCSPEIYSYD
jgi:hypothetical protein